VVGKSVSVDLKAAVVAATAGRAGNEALLNHCSLQSEQQSVVEIARVIATISSIAYHSRSSYDCGRCRYVDLCCPVVFPLTGRCVVDPTLVLRYE
jgi:hypothetical protein